MTGRTGHALAWTAMLLSLFVLMLYASDPAHASASNRIVRIGKQYLGTPYGHGPGELTCSEFTRKVFKRAVGATLPFSEDEQFYYGWQPKHPHKGDLVFFNEGTGGPPITHVGIKLPHGKILHSSSYPAFDGVVISDMQYIYGYKGARRLR